MADERQRKTSVGERNADPELQSDTTSNAAEETNPANDARSLDIGESGQYAPGGRYNELGVNSPRRIDLDDQVDSALKNEGK